jgi:hypothetical protein
MMWRAPILPSHVSRMSQLELTLNAKAIRRPHIYRPLGSSLWISYYCKILAMDITLHETSFLREHSWACLMLDALPNYDKERKIHIHRMRTCSTNNFVYAHDLKHFALALNNGVLFHFKLCWQNLKLKNSSLKYSLHYKEMYD